MVGAAPMVRHRQGLARATSSERQSIDPKCRKRRNCRKGGLSENAGRFVVRAMQSGAGPSYDRLSGSAGLVK